MSPLFTLAAGTLLAGVLFLRQRFRRLSRLRDDLAMHFTDVAAPMRRRQQALQALVALVREAFPHAWKINEAFSQAVEAEIVALRLANGRPEDARSIRDLTEARWAVVEAITAYTDHGIESHGSRRLQRVREEIELGEERIEIASRSFNTAAESYDRVRGRFPDTIFATLLNFGSAGRLNALPQPS